MRALPPLTSSVARRTRRLWRQYGVFWLGAIAVGLIAVLYARLIDFGYAQFQAMEHRHARSLAQLEDVEREAVGGD